MALLLSANLNGVFGGGGDEAATQRTAGLQALNALMAFQCGDGGFGMSRESCNSSPYLTAYVLHVLGVAGRLNAPVDQNAISNALSYLQNRLRDMPPEAQWWPAWASTQAYAVKLLAENRRVQPPDITRLFEMAERLPVFALSYLPMRWRPLATRGRAIRTSFAG
jgi:uncharacterized protein YfaS (alpha-2-macroglobulin family)